MVALYSIFLVRLGFIFSPLSSLLSSLIVTLNPLYKLGTLFDYSDIAGRDPELS